MRIEVHYESGGFSALKPEWNALLGRSRSDALFLTWEWQSTWWKHLGDGRLLLLGFRAEEDGRLVGIAPLFWSKTDQAQSLLFVVGCRDVSDYLDLIVERGQEEAVYQALLDYLQNEAPAWDVLDLCNLPQESLAPDRLRALAAARGFQTRVETEDVCPIIDLPATWDEYLSRLDKKQRHEVRRKLRRADSEADTRFVVVGDEHDLAAEMRAFIQLHQKVHARKGQVHGPADAGLLLRRGPGSAGAGLAAACLHRDRGRRRLPACSTSTTRTPSSSTTRATIRGSSRT